MSDFDSLMRHLTDRMAEQDAEIESLKRRLNNTFREGVVTGVDHKSGKARMKSNGLDSPDLPWATRSGGQQEWDPPAVGERVLMISPTGDPAQGIILPGGYSDQFKQPYDKPDSWYRKVGDATILADKDQVTLKFGEARITVSAKGIEIGIGAQSFMIGEAGTVLTTSRFAARRV